jgi:hypothetical protein
MTSVATDRLAGTVAAATVFAALAAIGYGCVRFLLLPENLWTWSAALSMCF